MNILKDKLQTEPAILISAIGAFLVALIQLLPMIFPAIEQSVISSLLDLVKLGIVVATVLFVRGNVYSPATFENAVSSQEAHRDAMAQ